MINIIVAGFKGKMGSTATQMVIDHEQFELVAVYDPRATETNISELPEFRGVAAPVFQDKAVLVNEITADVWIDFTMPSVALENTRFALENKMAPVVGTTGFSEAEVEYLIALSKDNQIGGLIAPNFAIGAVLMMEFAQKAGKYFQDVEILELHHDNKLDAPSGTAIKTAEMIAAVRSPKNQGNPQEEELIKGARGADYQGMKIHSVRLPGLIAHQHVQFGGVGEGLTIRHDSYDRQSFMTGVALGCQKVVELNQLVYGLEHIL